eukprot:11163795-Karenia_brevis.AAC.1
MLVWWEHVDSQANIADDGSRIGKDASIYAKHDIPMTDVPFPAWPDALSKASLAHWMEWLNSLIDGGCCQPLLNCSMAGG